MVDFFQFGTIRDLSFSFELFEPDRMDPIERIGLNDLSFAENRMFNVISGLKLRIFLIEAHELFMDFYELSRVGNKGIGKLRIKFEILCVDIEDKAARIFAGSVEISSVGFSQKKRFFALVMATKASLRSSSIDSKLFTFLSGTFLRSSRSKRRDRIPDLLLYEWS